MILSPASLSDNQLTNVQSALTKAHPLDRVPSPLTVLATPDVKKLHPNLFAGNSQAPPKGWAQIASDPDFADVIE